MSVQLKNPVQMFDTPKQKVTPTGKTLMIAGEIKVTKMQTKRVILQDGSQAFVNTFKGYLEFEDAEGREFSILADTFQGKIEILAPRGTQNVEVVAKDAVEKY